MVTRDPLRLSHHDPIVYSGNALQTHLWSKAIILVEVSKLSSRRASFNEKEDATICGAKLDLIEEERELTLELRKKF